MQSLRARLILITVLALLGIYTIAPSIIYFSLPKDVRNDSEAFEKAVPNWLPQKHVKLGLDLQGGVQLVLGVNVLEAVDNRLATVGVEVGRWAEDNKIPIASSYVVKDSQKLRIELQEGADVNSFNEKFKKEFDGFNLSKQDGLKFDYVYSDAKIRDIRNSAVEQAERVIRSRVDKWGVSETLISRRQDGNILVQLPGFKDPQQAKSLLGKTAQLKFKMVDSEFRGFDGLVANLPAGIEYTKIGEQTSFIGEDREQILALTKDSVPENRELLFERQSIAGNKNKARYQTYVVEAATELTGEDIMTATAGMGGGIDPTPVVSLRFTGAGGKRFGEVTSKYVGRYLAIVLDDEVVSAPVIQTKILDGRAEIRMGGARAYQEVIEEANELALILRSGSLPAKINVMEERQVGATLGPELANQGLMGAGVGLILVLALMVILYRRPGIIACGALILGGIWLLAIMGLFDFALTLPGIAGFILTLGMAVDANILINERIRYEAQGGKVAKRAVEVGFQRTLWTILDSNLTTLIAALVLLETNTSGPIRGFAVTLIIGIFISFFIALYVSKTFFDLALSRCKNEQQIRAWLGNESIEKMRVFSFNFVDVGRVVTYATVILALIIVGFSSWRGLNWGVDFAGGTEMHVAFSKDIDPSEIRKIAEQAGIEDVTVQAAGDSQHEFLLRFEAEKDDVAKADGNTSLQQSELNARSSEKVQALQQNLLTKLADYSPQILQADFVGPQVGKALRWEGFKSMVLSIIFIFLYIAIRFDSRFSPGVVVKMILDALLLLGFYAFFDRSFDLTSIAVFLTIIGYSVNDVVVVYDRVRENFTTHARRSVRDNVNVAVNETLTRSLNTSIVSILSLVGIVVFGEGQIREFALAMCLGVVIATMSTTFVASSLIIWSERWLKTFREKRRGGKPVATVSTKPV